MGNHLLNEGKLDEHLVICTFIFLIGRIGFKKLILPSSLNFCCSSFKGTKIQSLSVTWNAETENLMAKKGVSYPACLASHPILVLEPRNLKPFFSTHTFFPTSNSPNSQDKKIKTINFVPPDLVVIGCHVHLARPRVVQERKGNTSGGLAIMLPPTRGGEWIGPVGPVFQT